MLSRCNNQKKNETCGCTTKYNKKKTTLIFLFRRFLFGRRNKTCVEDKWATDRQQQIILLRGRSVDGNSWTVGHAGGGSWGERRENWLPMLSRYTLVQDFFGPPNLLWTYIWRSTTGTYFEWISSGSSCQFSRDKTNYVFKLSNWSIPSLKSFHVERVKREVTDDVTYLRKCCRKPYGQHGRNQNGRISVERWHLVTVRTKQQLFFFLLFRRSRRFCRRSS